MEGGVGSRGLEGTAAPIEVNCLVTAVVGDATLRFWPILALWRCATVDSDGLPTDTTNPDKTHSQRASLHSICAGAWTDRSMPLSNWWLQASRLDWIVRTAPAHPTRESADTLVRGRNTVEPPSHAAFGSTGKITGRPTNTHTRKLDATARQATHKSRQPPPLPRPAHHGHGRSVGRAKSLTVAAGAGGPLMAELQTLRDRIQKAEADVVDIRRAFHVYRAGVNQGLADLRSRLASQQRK